jgi:3-methylfumaryl-CoA hydratase
MPPSPDHSALPNDASSATLDPSALARLKDWEGRTETVADEIAAAPLRGLSATLDRDDPPPAPGTPVPELGHWLYFLPQHRQSGIGPDGHAQRGGFLPPVPLPRRMWAGGRLRWEAGNPLRVGDAAERRSRIVSVDRKSGRSGDLVFVMVRHEVRNARGLALSEEHDIVYRGEPGGAVPAAVAAAGATAATASPGSSDGPGAAAAPVASAGSHDAAAFSRELLPDDVLLFRYSALTFNGHRIHYDRRYVTGVEGYPGLIVHGPLIATLLADLLRRERPGRALARFDFRAVRPSFDGAPLRLEGRPRPGEPDGFELRAVDAATGALAMQATATLA